MGTKMIAVVFKRCLFTFILAATILALGLLVWFMRPFMSTGTTIQIEHRQYSAYEIQIWQRKNASFMEPFTTAMFARMGSNQNWRAFSLGFRDSYAPHFAFHQTNSNIAITREGKKVGEFEMGTGEYLRVGQTHAIDEGITTNPSHWWSLPAKQILAKQRPDT
jgi:hypothetical protein